MILTIIYAASRGLVSAARSRSWQHAERRNGTDPALRAAGRPHGEGPARPRCGSVQRRSAGDGLHGGARNGRSRRHVRPGRHGPAPPFEDTDFAAKTRIGIASRHSRRPTRAPSPGEVTATTLALGGAGMDTLEHAQVITTARRSIATEV